MKELEAGGSKPAPRSAHGWLSEAGQQSAAGNFAQAVKALDRALALLPNLGTALLLKGEALLEMGHSKKAMGCYEEGLRSDGSDPRLWNAKGAALARQRRHDEALGCYDEALRLDPGHAPARSGRAWALLQCGRHQEALTAFDEVLAADARHALARFGKACAEDQLGRAAPAARSYRKFLDAAPRALGPQVDHARARLKVLKP